MRQALLASIAVLVLCPAAAEARFLGEREALRAAAKAAEDGPFEVTRHGRSLVRLDAQSSETREYDAACPDGFGCSPECRWTETSESKLQVWVRELRNGRYRVHDNLGFSVTIH